jgi:hypothetical protein
VRWDRVNEHADRKNPPHVTTLPEWSRGA